MLATVCYREALADALTENPVRRVDKPRVDRRGKVRFLDQAEESQLRKALMERDVEMQNLRTAANERRQKRHKRLLPPLAHFADHLTPAVLLSMNTGLRRGEVIKLRWASVDFNRRLLTVEGRHAKNRQTRHVPLNDEAFGLLRWREQSGSQARVFDVSSGFGCTSACEPELNSAALAQLLQKRRHECATMDHPVADKQSRRRIDKPWYPFRNQIVESIDRRRFRLGVP